MCDVCGDNRFEIIEAYKRKLIEATNIETSPEEMAVIDNILLRFWQMGWLPAAQPERKGKWIKENCRGQAYKCSVCGNWLDFRGVNAGRGSANFCPNCGSRNEVGEQDG